MSDGRLALYPTRRDQPCSTTYNTHIETVYHHKNLFQIAAFLSTFDAKSSHLPAEPLQNKSAVKGWAEYQHVHSLPNLSSSVILTGAANFSPETCSADVVMRQ
jgi:hypothetical protein